MKKIFIVAGEASGDRLAAWYVHKRRQKEALTVEAVGGALVQAEGAYLYENFTKLNVVGVVEIIRRLPVILRFMRQLVTYITQHEFDEVIVVDFPGFNLRLIKHLKKIKPTLTVIYLSPPQLWCWGAWRINTLKKYCDRVIVLYPFEVAWYRERGLTVEWQGSPVYELLRPYRVDAEHKKNCIALIPGSRASEVATMLPLFLQAAASLLHNHPELRFVIPVAQSMSEETLRTIARNYGLESIWGNIQCIRGEDEKYKALAHCCGALSKPGTVTLELALLRVPTVVAFKVSWLTYLLARPLVRVTWMSLPNLLTGKERCKEIIQYNCTAPTIAREIEGIYREFSCQRDLYNQRLEQLDDVARVLTRENVS